MVILFKVILRLIWEIGFLSLDFLIMRLWKVEADSKQPVYELWWADLALQLQNSGGVPCACN